MGWSSAIANIAMTPNGLVKSERHCRYVRPLSMGLIEKENIPKVAAELDRKCRERDYTIGTGFSHHMAASAGADGERLYGDRLPDPTE